MAEIAGVVAKIDKFMDDAHVITWADLATGDTGSIIEMPGSADRSIQFSGTFGGATIVLQGSNDGVNWETLTDPQGVSISKTAAALVGVLELTRYVRPSVSGGAAVAIDATLLVKRK